MYLGTLLGTMRILGSYTYSVEVTIVKFTSLNLFQTGVKIMLTCRLRMPNEGLTPENSNGLVEILGSSSANSK